MEKYQAAGPLIIRRPCPVVYEETGSAKRKTFEFFHFLEALEDYVNEGRIFSKENWYISKRNMELLEDRVQPCH